MSFQGFGAHPHSASHHYPQQQQNDSFKIYDSPSPGFRPAGVKVVDLLRKESEASSGAGSLNNVNHLRRGGYMAPVNSEADYGLYSGPPSSVFGPCSAATAAKVKDVSLRLLVLCCPSLLTHWHNQRSSIDPIFSIQIPIQLQMIGDLDTFFGSGSGLKAKGSGSDQNLDRF